MCIMTELTNFEVIKSSVVYKAKKKETFYLVGQTKATKKLRKVNRRKDVTEVMASLLRYYALNTTKSFIACEDYRLEKRGGHDSWVTLLLGRVKCC